MGDPITWYLLGRTVIDTQSILEAVDEKLLTHNLDPSAHGQTNEAVYEHRTDEEVDHPDASIKLKKFFSAEVGFMTAFESLDGWTKSATGIEGFLYGIKLETGNNINTEKQMFTEPYGPGNSPDFTKNPFFQTTLALTGITEQHVYFFSGNYLTDVETEAFGFKVHDGTLYALRVKVVGGVGTEYTTEIAGVTLTDFNVYRAQYDSVSNEIRYYVNGVLKVTETTNLPTLGQSMPFLYDIENTEAVSKTMFVRNLIFSQDN